MRQWFASAASNTAPLSRALARRHTAEGSDDSVLAEVALPGSIRSQQGAYGVHPALLDACFQSVGAHPRCKRRHGGMLLPLGVRRLRATARREAPTSATVG